MTRKGQAMSTQAMSTVELYRRFHPHGMPVRGPSRAPARGEKRGIVRRIFAAIARWEQRRVEDEAGRFIAAHGGRLTDDIERQLAARLANRGY
jgi:hypothetical protein